MFLIRLGLAYALVACALATIGCESQARITDPDDVVLFGRVPDVSTVCFNVGAELVSLSPSIVCDPEGETAFSFNIEVEAGSDATGELCSFSARVEEPIPVMEGGIFSLQNVQLPGTEGFVTIQGSLTSGGSVETGTGVGVVRQRIGEGGTEQTCEAFWNASTDPVCFEEAAERCNLLLTCCQSIYLLPPVESDCLSVVNACDPDVCEEVLSGYTQCAQPPICNTEEDPFGFCVALETCCNTEDLTKDELVECLDTASACVVSDCVSLLGEYPDCALPPGFERPE